MTPPGFPRATLGCRREAVPDTRPDSLCNYKRNVKSPLEESMAGLYWNLCSASRVVFIYLGLHPQHIEVPRQGSNQSYSSQPTPQLTTTLDP